jgi:hypothetical protein
MAKRPPIDDEDFAKGMQVAVLCTVDDFAEIGSHEINTLNGLLVTVVGQMAGYDEASTVGLLRLLADTIERGESSIDPRQSRTHLEQMIIAFEQRRGFPTTVGRA